MRRVSLISKCIFGLLIFGVSFSTAAQESMELGGWIGGSYYFGDLNTRFGLADPNLAGGLIYRYNFNGRIAFKGGINYTHITASDADSNNAFELARNLSFSTNVFDINGQLEFNFFEYEHGHEDNWYTPYIFLGIAGYHFNPKADLNGQTFRLQELATEGQAIGGEYSRYGLAAIYGVGYKFDISPKWSMNIELSNRLMFTDYFDDVSGVYPDQDVLLGLRGQNAVDLSNRSLDNTFDLGITGKQRGNSRKNDSVHYIGISLLYTINWLRCPDISE